MDEMTKEKAYQALKQLIEAVSMPHKDFMAFMNCLELLAKDGE